MLRNRRSLTVSLSLFAGLALPVTVAAGASLPPPDSAPHSALAYLQNGNLYVKEMPDSPARCLLDQKRYYGSPIWSPNGKWIAIRVREDEPNVNNLNFQIVSRQGRTVCLLRLCDSEIAWAPDGNRILWQSKDDQTIHITDLGTGRTRVLLTPPKDSNLYSLVWSPDGGTIAYIAGNSIICLNIATGQKHTLLSEKSSRAYTVSFNHLSWSPDGKWLAFIKYIDKPETDDETNSRKEEDSFNERIEARSPYPTEVWRLRADNGQEAHRLYRSHGHFRVPILQEWTSDSSCLLFWALVYSPAASANRDGVSIYSASVKSKSARLLSGHYRTDSMDGSDMVLSRPDFVASRPGGSTVAVSVGEDRYLASGKRITLFQPSAGRKHYLTKAGQSAICPVWSPDQRRLAYLATKTYKMKSNGGDAEAAAEANFRIWIMNADGSHPRRLETGMVNTDQAPVWLADGRHLLFTKGDYGSPKSLWMIDANGQHLQCLVSALGANPKASRLEDREGDFAVWSPPPSTARKH